MKVFKDYNLKPKLLALTVPNLAVVCASVSFAAQSSIITAPIKSKAVQGIEAMCAMAAESIARQPEAEGKLKSLVEECELALDGLGKFGFRF